MLWDWSQITLAESIVFSLLSIGVLYMVGFGCIGLIIKMSKRADPFVSLDLLQKATFRILFGFVFILLFAVIFSFFGFAFSISTLMIVGIVVFGLVINRSTFRFRLPDKLEFKRIALLILVSAILLISLFLSSIFVAGSYGATNDDGADHTLMTRIVIDNPNVLFTRSGLPYANFLIRYPLGTHVLSAFFVTLSGVPIQQIVVLFSAIFPVLIVLSFYSLAKSIFGRKSLAVLSLFISAFFVVGLLYTPISWGGLPLLLSFFLTISSMGLIFSFLLNDKLTAVKAFLIGALFFTAIRTYPITLLIMFTWFLFVLIAKLVMEYRKVSAWHFLSVYFVKKNAQFFLAFLLPVLLAAPYFYALFTNNFDDTQTTLLTIVTTWSDTIKTTVGFNWLFDFPTLSFFFSSFGSLLALTPFCLIPLVILSIPRISQKISNIINTKGVRLGIVIVYIFAILILAYLTLTLYLPIGILTAFFDPARVLQHLFIPAVILTSVAVFFVCSLLYFSLKRPFENGGKIHKMQIGKLNRNKILACALLVLVVISSLFYILPIISEQQSVYNRARVAFNDLQTLKEDDVLLMKWVKENIPADKNILVSSGDSGQFLASVTQHRTISINSRLGNYSDLMVLLSSNSSDERAIPLMIQYNISYVYIGSIATTYALSTPYYRSFNSTQFLATQYLMPVKDVGKAWLFEFNATKALTFSSNY